MSTTSPAARAGASLFAAAWEARRRGYARGWLRPRRVPARVVSIGNLTVGGTGKTTLALHLVRLARARGLRATVVARDYRPGPAGRADESLLYARAFGAETIFTGRRKTELAARAAAAGWSPIVIDDGFSTWSLERDLDIVLLDARDLWGGGALLPAGRLREPRRALQRAEVVVISRLAAGEDPAPWMDEARRYAPAALIAAGRHRVAGVRRLDGSAAAGGGRVRVVTATGNPDAVAASAKEAGLDVAALARYRDHHWFTAAEAERERRLARDAGATLLMTAKDGVRWPAPADPDVRVLEVEWAWVANGEAVERLAFEEDAR
ncbi:MAG: tetraacyldisaccharide 4'-kinase [Candidatus Eisenbacteria bacterium]|uniref:Tetraacyldisaccharide 4'-kinase n=1 Tax=Eiseniibacteriota bacterium TaxID=2212470 RepID=A0A9D6LAS2_UNCEI|nr:tetraacyldisaccharide 4'-kinase [Candidatus Eisenbacteria bacterium]MBI3540017.1 tetraacyldisaccharide 4'-kinase [Candidatus Eisenbacteria bacterium]